MAAMLKPLKTVSRSVSQLFRFRTKSTTSSPNHNFITAQSPVNLQMAHTWIIENLPAYQMSEDHSIRLQIGRGSHLILYDRELARRTSGRLRLIVQVEVEDPEGFMQDYVIFRCRTTHQSHPSVWAQFLFVPLNIARIRRYDRTYYEILEEIGKLGKVRRVHPWEEDSGWVHPLLRPETWVEPISEQDLEEGSTTDSVSDYGEIIHRRQIHSQPQMDYVITTPSDCGHSIRESMNSRWGE